jgi:hypothetical protein
LRSGSSSPAKNDAACSVAHRLGAGPDDLVEVERLAGQEHVAIELGRSEVQVERARLVLQVARVLGLEPAEHGVGRHALEARRGARGVHGFDDGLHLGRVARERLVEPGERAPCVEPPSRLIGRQLARSEVVPGVDRRNVELVLHLHQGGERRRRLDRVRHR